jgi:hypothetical protein
MVGVQLNAKQFQLAAVRIKAILTKYALTQYIPTMTTTGAIAAINSLLPTGYQIIHQGNLRTAQETDLYTTSSTATQPLNVLMSLKDNDPSMLSIVSSKPYLLYWTNADPIIAFNDTSNPGSPYSVRQTSGNKTIKVNSLTAYVNFVAAGGQPVVPTSTTTLAIDTYPGINNYYTIMKCIYGEQDPTDVCVTSAWTNTAALSMLSFNTLLENSFIKGTIKGDDGYGVTDLSVITNFPVANTGDYASFNNTYTKIRDLAGGVNNFLPIYNGLNYDRAVTMAEYRAMHDTITNINLNYDFIGTILKDAFTMNLIGKGIITFEQANNDYSTPTLKYLQQNALKMWAANLPLALPPSTDGTTAWAEYSDHIWFASFANDTALGQMLLNDQVTFSQLITINQTSNFGMNAGIFGTGDLTNNDSPYDTQANFDGYFAEKANAIALIKAGLPINALCAGDPGFACSMTTASLGIVAQNNTKDTPGFSTFWNQTNNVPVGSPTTTDPYLPYATELGGAASASSFQSSSYNCATHPQVLALLTAYEANFWPSTYDLMSDIMTNLCAPNIAG